MLSSVSAARDCVDMIDNLLGMDIINGRDPLQLREIERKKGSKSPRSRFIRELEDDLDAVLRAAWAASGKAAIDDMLTAIDTAEGIMTKAELAEVLEVVTTRMDITSFASTVTSELRDVLSSSYDFGRVTFEPKPQFNLVDVNARDWLVRDQMFWVGNRYGADVAPRIAKTAKEVVIEQGLSRAEAGNALKEIFEPEFGPRQDTYWRGLAGNAVTRARNFGAVESFVQAEFENIEIVAVMDERTSDICRYLNGKVFTVAAAVKQRDKMLAAPNPDAVKRASKWLTFAQIDGKTPEQLMKMGVCLPPYHFHCRTIAIAT